MALACNLLPLQQQISLSSAVGVIAKPGSQSIAFPIHAFTAFERVLCQHASGDVGARKKAFTTMSVSATEGRLGGRGGGAGLLERPGLDQSSPDTAPRTEEGGEMGKSSQRVRFGGGDRYRVLLLDHERHTEAQVAKVIPRVVPSVTPDEARKCFYESREFGVALVTIAVKEHAEFYVQMLTRYGLRTSMEQDRSPA